MTEASARPSFVGQSFGSYKIEREIGHGGMATVYVAEDRRHGRRVALKVLNQKISFELGAERFLREIQTAARLTHPNIVPLHDSGETENQLYYVMPLVAGESLRARLRRDGPLPVAEALRLAAEVAEALDYAHRQGVVHRDVKPENILLAEGHCFVVDFGIAHAIEESAGDRLTATGLVLGTPAYMSPEQAGGEREIDARSDVFSLGAVLFEMLTGESPFKAPTAAATLARVLTATAPRVREQRPDVPHDVDEVLRLALAKSPGDRFQSAGEMANRLHGLATTVATTSSEQSRLTGRLRRHPRLIAAGLLVVASIAAGLAWQRTRGETAAGSSSPEQSVAVLTFRDEGADSGNAYFASGIAEELLNALADVPGLRVASGTASFSLDPAVRTPRDIGRRLAVTTILEGSVRRSHENVRVNARLVNAADGAVIWSGSTDGPASDVFAVQEKIARTIVDRMRVRLISGEKNLVRRRTEDPRVYDMVLKARHVRRGNQRQNLLEAARLLHQALALDSAYAETHAQLADVYESLAVFGDQVALPDGVSMPAGELLRRARLAAQRAVELDTQSPAAHIALGVLLFRYDWNWPAAEAEFRRALELQPASSLGHARYSRFLRSMGRFAEARQQLDSARKYDATTEATGGVGVARISFFARDFERAIREQVADSNPGASRTAADWLAQSYVGARAYAKAESILTRAPESRAVRATRAYIYALTGRAREARALISADEGNENDILSMHAGVYAVLGDTAMAMSEIDRAILTRDPLVVDFKVAPWLDPLRSHPRFVAVMKQLAFPPN